ncbi:HlyD family type I secretion periplasmic adaptor subunit, partial [Pseudomonas chlororaphis]
MTSSIKDSILRYFKGTESLHDQPLPEVNKALIEDAPRVIRLTIWGIIGFFLFLLLWANFAV